MADNANAHLFVELHEHFLVEASLTFLERAWERCEEAPTHRDRDGTKSVFSLVTTNQKRPRGPPKTIAVPTTVRELIWRSLDEEQKQFVPIRHLINSGWLWYRSTETGRWKERYFVLHGRPPNVEFFHLEQISELDNALYPRITVENVIDVYPTNIDREFGIHIISHGETFILAAANERFQHEWIRALVAVVYATKSVYKSRMPPPRRRAASVDYTAGATSSPPHQLSLGIAFSQSSRALFRRLTQVWHDFHIPPLSPGNSRATSPRPTITSFRHRGKGGILGKGGKAKSDHGTLSHPLSPRSRSRLKLLSACGPLIPGRNNRVPSSYSNRDAFSPTPKRRSSADEINFYAPPGAHSLPSSSSPLSRGRNQASTSSRLDSHAYLDGPRAYSSSLASPSLSASSAKKKTTLSQAFAERRKASLSQSTAAPIRKSSRVTVRAEITINMDDASSIGSVEHDVLVSAEVVESGVNMSLSRESAIVVTRTSIEVEDVRASPPSRRSVTPPPRSGSPPMENPELLLLDAESSGLASKKESLSHSDFESDESMLGTSPPLANPDGPSSVPTSPRRSRSDALDDGEPATGKARVVEETSAKNSENSSDIAAEAHDGDDAASPHDATEESQVGTPNTKLHPVIDAVKSFLRQQKSMYDTLLKPMADFASSVTSGSSRDLTASTAETEPAYESDDEEEKAVEEKSASAADSVAPGHESVGPNLEVPKRDRSVKRDNSASRIEDNWEEVETEGGGSRRKISEESVGESEAEAEEEKCEAEAEEAEEEAPKRSTQQDLYANMTQRDRIIREILITELEYNLNLKTLELHYAKPMFESQILSPADFQELFSFIIMIAQFHEIILQEMQKASDDRNAASPQGSIAFVLAKHAQNFRCYSPYVCGYEKMVSTLNRIYDENSRFADLLKERRQLTGQDIMSLLITPVQRMPRYELLLRGLLKETPEGHVEHESIKSAINSIHETNVWINETKRRKDRLNRVTDIQKLLRGDRIPLIADDGRVLVKDGYFECFRLRKRWSVGSGLVPSVVYLFNDCVVWCTNRYYFKDILHLRTCEVQTAPTVLKHPELGFQITDTASPTSIYPLVVSCTTEGEANDWVAELRKLIDDAKREDEGRSRGVSRDTSCSDNSEQLSWYDSNNRIIYEQPPPSPQSSPRPSAAPPSDLEAEVPNEDDEDVPAVAKSVPKRVLTRHHTNIHGQGVPGGTIMAVVLPELQQREDLSVAEALAAQKQVKPKPKRPTRRYGAPMKVAPKLSAGDDELDAVRRRIDSMSDPDFFKVSTGTATPPSREVTLSAVDHSAVDSYERIVTARYETPTYQRSSVARIVPQNSLDMGKVLAEVRRFDKRGLSKTITDPTLKPSRKHLVSPVRTAPPRHHLTRIPTSSSTSSTSSTRNAVAGSSSSTERAVNISKQAVCEKCGWYNPLHSLCERCNWKHQQLIEASTAGTGTSTERPSKRKSSGNSRHSHEDKSPYMPVVTISVSSTTPQPSSTRNSQASVGSTATHSSTSSRASMTSRPAIDLSPQEYCTDDESEDDFQSPRQYNKVPVYFSLPPIPDSLRRSQVKRRPPPPPPANGKFPSQKKRNSSLRAFAMQRSAEVGAAAASSSVPGGVHHVPHSSSSASPIARSSTSTSSGSASAKISWVSIFRPGTDNSHNRAVSAGALDHLPLKHRGGRPRSPMRTATCEPVLSSSSAALRRSPHTSPVRAPVSAPRPNTRSRLSPTYTFKEPPKRRALPEKSRTQPEAPPPPERDFHRRRSASPRLRPGPPPPPPKRPSSGSRPATLDRTLRTPPTSPLPPTPSVHYARGNKRNSLPSLFSGEKLGTSRFGAKPSRPPPVPPRSAEMTFVSHALSPTLEEVEGFSLTSRMEEMGEETSVDFSSLPLDAASSSEAPPPQVDAGTRSNEIPPPEMVSVSITSSESSPPQSADASASSSETSPPPTADVGLNSSETSPIESMETSECASLHNDDSPESSASGIALTEEPVTAPPSASAPTDESVTVSTSSSSHTDEPAASSPDESSSCTPAHTVDPTASSPPAPAHSDEPTASSPPTPAHTDEPTASSPPTPAHSDEPTASSPPTPAHTDKLTASSPPAPAHAGEKVEVSPPAPAHTEEKAAASPSAPAPTDAGAATTPRRKTKRGSSDANVWPPRSQTERIRLLAKGTILIRVPRKAHSKPKPVHFFLRKNHAGRWCVYWESNTKSRGDCTVYPDECRLAVGQTTKIFARHKKLAKHAGRSFSLFDASASSTPTSRARFVDVVAPDDKTFQLWIATLKRLVVNRSGSSEDSSSALSLSSLSLSE